jgi:RNA polymerase sigma factor (sigma-70 family)
MRDDPTVLALVAGAKRGDQRSWNGLVERYAPLVWGVCRRYGLADADAHDVGQTVWLRLVEHLPALREPAALPGWLITTTRRECAVVQRAVRERARREQVEETDITADPEATAVDRWLVAEERGAALRAAFDDLPPRCRELLALLLADPPVSYAEISTRLEMAVGSIGPSRARCLDRLRQSRAIRDLLGEGPGDDAGPPRRDGTDAKGGRGDGRDERMAGR